MKLNLTRDQLASFLGDYEKVKQFERLFQIADQVSSASDTLGISIEAANAQASANAAHARIDALDSASPAQEQHGSIATDYIDLLNAPTVQRKARFAWNETEQTAELGMEYGVIQQIGMETFARVQNDTGVSIPDGTLVGITGAGGSALLTVAPYLADGSSTSFHALGVLTHTLPNAQNGYCTLVGHVRGIDTTGTPYGETWSVGDTLFASATIAGGLTNVKPTPPNLSIPVAEVLSVSVTGQIFVRPVTEQAKYYGVFEKTTDQSPVAINTEYLLTFDAAQIENGVSIGSPASRILVSDSGRYQFIADVQITSTNATQKNVWIWFKKNGAAVANSARILTSNINNGYLQTSICETFVLNANDYIEMAFAADNVNVTIDNVAATAFAPAAPAIVLSVNQL